MDVLICTKANRPKGHAGNWLELLPDPLPHVVIVRQTFLKREQEQVATLRLERIGEPTRPSDVSPESLIAGLETCGLFVAGASMMFARWAAELRGSENQLPIFNVERSNKMGGDPNIRYYHSYWRVAKVSTAPRTHHTLIIRLRLRLRLTLRLRLRLRLWRRLRDVSEKIACGYRAS